METSLSAKREVRKEINAKITPLPWKRRFSIRWQLLQFAIFGKVAFNASNGTPYAFGKIRKHRDWKGWAHLYSMTKEIAEDFFRDVYCCTLTVEDEHVMILYARFFDPKLMLIRMLFDKKIPDYTLLSIIVENPAPHVLTDTPAMESIVQGLNANVPTSLVSLLSITN
jgi:hypothetical protein